MHIYLQHQTHGRKIAYLEEEAKHDELNGWVRYNPNTPSHPEEAASVNALKPGRGRPRKVIDTTEKD